MGGVTLGIALEGKAGEVEGGVEQLLHRGRNLVQERPARGGVSSKRRLRVLSVQAGRWRQLNDLSSCSCHAANKARPSCTQMRAHVRTCHMRAYVCTCHATYMHTSGCTVL